MMATSRFRIGVGAALLAGALVAQTTSPPLERLETGDEKVGWDGVRLGMSAVQVERRVGVTLAMQVTEKKAAAVSTCKAFTVTVERGTLWLTLGFPSAKPAAKLQSIYVHFEGYQVAAKLDALVGELKTRVPGVSYLPRRGATATAEGDDPAPAYLLPGGGGYVARLMPSDGLLLTLRDCLD